MGQRNFLRLASVLAMALPVACSKDKPAEPEPRAPAAKPLEVVRPAGAAVFQVDAASSRFTFLMDSPLEKIEGDAPGAVQGELFVEPSDLAKSTALVKADLNLLTLYQQKRADEQGEYGVRKKSESQNAHARDWLQLNPKDGEVSAEQAEQNRFAELRINTLTNLSAADVTKLSGPERKVTATATGDFRLHGRKATKSARLELTFKYAGDKLEAVMVKTLEPFSITLEEFEIHPRDAAGKFVKSLTDALSGSLKGKVAKDAPVSVAFTANAK